MTDPRMIEIEFLAARLSRLLSEVIAAGDRHDAQDVVLSVAEAAQRLKITKPVIIRMAKKAGEAKLLGGRLYVRASWVEKKLADLLA